MKACLTFLFSVPLWANYSNQVSVLLDVGAKTVAITNTGSVGGVTTMTFSPPATRRVRFTITPIPVPPPSGSTYSACADPCGVSINRQSGQQYYVVEYVDSAGSPLSPPLISAFRSAYDRGSCGGVGTLPMIEPTITTTAPMPMPREVIGQDCYVDRIRLPLATGHASTSLRLWVRIHAAGYNDLARWDGKVSFQVNSGAWITLSNSNSSVHPADETQWFTRVNSSSQYGNSDFTTLPLNVGGYPQVRDYLIDIPNGTVGSGDTTWDLASRFNGTEGLTSGFRLLEAVLVEGTDKTLTQIVCSASGVTCVSTSTANGLTNGDSVVVRGAPQMRMVFNGYHILTAKTTDTFTFPACEYQSGRSKSTSCIMPTNSTVYKPPVNRNPIQNYATDQVSMYATRMLTAASAFTYTDPTTWTAPGGGDATRGGCLFRFNNTTCTTGPNLVNSSLPYFSYSISAKCADCHSPTGADLKYYNFSNQSIIQRSYFHGVNDQGALDIAAYIRGNAMAVPTQARPWNPPMQTGPGMSNGTWRKTAANGFSATLTNIVASSSVCTATTTVDPLIKAGDPLYIFGATVDTDLNGKHDVTSVSSTTIVFPCPSVSNATYTDAGLVLNMANDYMAGCGIDCVRTYGFDDDMFGAYSSAWNWNNHIEARDIAYQFQLGDWNKAWLAPIHPIELPRGDFFNSTPYTKYATFKSCMTQWDFATYKSCGYLPTLHDDFIEYWIRDFGIAVQQDLPTKTDAYANYAPASAAWTPHSIHTLFRQGVINEQAKDQWVLAQEWGILPMNAQRMTDLNGTATANGCYPPWGFPSKTWVFNTGYHKVKMDQRGTLDPLYSTETYGANDWYVVTPGINGGDCYDSPDNPIDNSYYQAFLNITDSFRPSGFAKELAPTILSPQTGNQQTNFAPFLGPGTPGTDWAQTVMKIYDVSAPFSWFWFTDAQTNYVWDSNTHMIVALQAAHDATYWNTVWTYKAVTFGGNTDCSVYAAWLPGSTSVCDGVTATITWSKLFGSSASATDLASMVAFWKTIPAFTSPNPANHFDDALASAVEGDQVDIHPSCSGCGAAGSITLTFSSGSGGCPQTSANMQFNKLPTVIYSSGAEMAELLYPTGGTCAARGGSGTLTFTTARAHSGTPLVTWGCSQLNLQPNWPADLFNPTVRQFRCGNMTFP